MNRIQPFPRLLLSEDAAYQLISEIFDVPRHQSRGRSALHVSIASERKWPGPCIFSRAVTNLTELQASGK
ncbi:hypothetical protein PSPO01_16171 [Paraphaeosphaeria sporulosa]